jgi:cell division topological specificity factor
MAGFLDWLFGRNTKRSGLTAKDRLQMVLVYDRIQISPEKMREMKEEIVAVILRYVPEVDPTSIDIVVEQNDRFNNKIVAEIPFSKPRGVPIVDDDENDDLRSAESGERSWVMDEDSPIITPNLEDTARRDT